MMKIFLIGVRLVNIVTRNKMMIMYIAGREIRNREKAQNENKSISQNIENINTKEVNISTKDTLIASLIIGISAFVVYLLFELTGIV